MPHYINTLHYHIVHF